ncbi:glycoside hydrolase family 26 protein [Phocaeicola coprocola]|uniref:glycoside hydrolase family 26 protein n=1 Tax=Phocaeicola coprocola TaxID=310298 RepID=UPI00266FC3EE|nr:glycosyl hydrolase [Phocaeicola coprocola]
MKYLLLLISYLLSFSCITAKEKDIFFNHKKGCLIGRENDLCLGVRENSETWSYQFQTDTIQNLIHSDIYRITQKYPALLGMDLGEDAINRHHPKYIENFKNCIKSYYNLTHGVISISYHMENPWWFYEGKKGSPYRYKSLEHRNVVQEILHDSVKLPNNITVKKWYDTQIEKVIEIISDLKDKKGNAIPIILRLFHEGSHNAFWWGYDYCTKDEYKELFIYTTQLIKSRCPNKILIAYSPDYNWNTLSPNDRYMDRYPGNNYVDILGLDNYHIKSEEGIAKCINQLQQLTEYGNKYNKIVALTETGCYGLNISNWFTEYLYKVITAPKVKISYVMFWSSWSSKNNGYCIPYKKDSPETKDFLKFTQKKNIILINNNGKTNSSGTL